MEQLIKNIAQELVDSNAKIDVSLTYPDENTNYFIIKLDRNDVGKVVGKQGKNINAIRTIAMAISAKNGKRVRVDVVER